jgi:amino acid transporter
LADENLGPKALAKLSNSRGTPVVSLVIVLVVTIALLGLPNKPLDFTFLVVIDVFFSVVVCALTVVSAIILKRRIDPKDVPFKAPFGRTGHTIMSGICLFFCVAIVLLNGTDYFLGGFAIMLLIPILYVFGKLKFKGLTVKEPDLYPIDKRTGLAFGDLTRLAYYYICFGLFAILARFFLHWYELDWGVEYYIEEYETGLFSDFYAMLMWITILGVASLVVGLVLRAVGEGLKNKQK